MTDLGMTADEFAEAMYLVAQMLGEDPDAAKAAANPEFEDPE